MLGVYGPEGDSCEANCDGVPKERKDLKNVIIGNLGLNIFFLKEIAHYWCSSCRRDC